MMVVFHSATWACSYFSAGPRAVSQACAMGVSPAAARGVRAAYAVGDLLELFCWEGRLALISVCRLDSGVSVLTAIVNVDVEMQEERETEGRVCGRRQLVRC